MKTLNATQKGLVTGLLMIAVMLIIFYKLNQQPNSILQFSSFLIIYIGGILWSMLTFNRTVQPQTKLSEYFSNGFKTFVVVTLIMTLYTFIFYKLNPGIRDAQIAFNTQLLEQQHTHTQQEIDMNAAQFKSIFMTVTISTTIFIYLLLGSIITLLSSVILKQLKKT